MDNCPWCGDGFSQLFLADSYQKQEKNQNVFATCSDCKKPIVIKMQQHFVVEKPKKESGEP